jgi:hypothetical protein
MKLRKLGLGVVFICSTLLLTSCIEVKGAVSINSAARWNGEISYTLNKSLASAAGISSLDDLNRQATEQSASEVGFCKNTPFTEDATNYIFKCPLKDAISQTGDLTAVIVGRNIIFRYKQNLDSTSTESERIDLGSVSVLVTFIDPIISYKENKIGLVQKIDALTYRISGYATEPMDIEIVANCSSRCGITNTVPTPTPTKTINPVDAAAAATDAANASTDAANLAAEPIDSETQEFLDLVDIAIQKAKTTGIKTELNSKKVLATNQEILAQVQSKQTNAENLTAKYLALSNDKTLPTEAQRLYLSTYNSWSRTLRTLTSYKNQVSQRVQRISDSQALVNKAAEEFLAQQPVVNKANPILKKNTITCIKGKLTKKVTAVNPKCPAGYKKK